MDTSIPMEIPSRELKLIDKPLHKTIIVRALDDSGPGGANHAYSIEFTMTKDGNGVVQPVPDNLHINFQKGAVNEVGINGVSDEALLEIIIDRAAAFSKGPFSSAEGTLALRKLQEAKFWLRARYEDRAERGVEGYNKK